MLATFQIKHKTLEGKKKVPKEMITTTKKKQRKKKPEQQNQDTRAHILAPSPLCPHFLLRPLFN